MMLNVNRFTRFYFQPAVDVTVMIHYFS